MFHRNESAFYLIHPVGVRDGDVVTTEMSKAPPVVEDGCKVRKVAVQIKILSISPTTGPSIVLMTLKRLQIPPVNNK